MYLHICAVGVLMCLCCFLAVSECMSISPERRQTAMPAAGSTPASRDGRPSRQQRFMADMRATVPLGEAVVPRMRHRPSACSQSAFGGCAHALQN